MDNSTVSVVLIVQDEDIKPEICIESILECNNMIDVPFVVYNNSNNVKFHKWASEKNNFIYAYSENGIEKYGDVVIQILKELNLKGHILLLSGHHMAFPNIISDMLSLLSKCSTYGLVAASYNGARDYGLSYETFARDYMQLAEYSMKLGKEKSWESSCLDHNGVYLINECIVEEIKLFEKGLDKDLFFARLCNAVRLKQMSIQVPEGIFWWNLNDSSYNTLKNLPKSGIELTIAIPTYNRGHRTLDAVRKLLESREKYGYEDIIEILVSDNASTKYIEEIEEIEEIANISKNMICYRSEENKGFKGNIRKVLELSNGKYCLIHSDEDNVIFPALLLYIDYLRLHPNVSCMKGRTTFQYFEFGTSFGRVGLDAYNCFFLKGNYISGIIYNRNVVTSEFVEKLYNEFDKKQNMAFDYYPHLFIDAYALSHGDFASSNIFLIQEGAAEDSGEKDSSTEMFSYERPESRIEQGKGYFPLLGFLKLDDRTKMILYIKICMKTIYLLELSKNKYLRSGYDWNKIVDNLMNILKNGFFEIRLLNQDVFYDFVIDYLSNTEKELRN